MIGVKGHVEIRHTLVAWLEGRGACWDPWACWDHCISYDEQGGGNRVVSTLTRWG